jgi:WD40 repeat protein
LSPCSSYTEPLDISCSLDGASRSAWRPKEGVLLTTLKEHSGAVNRLVISPDQAFFASASADRTVKIWQTRQLDRVAFPRYDFLGVPLLPIDRHRDSFCVF